jgi:hypothetical protein
MSCGSGSVAVPLTTLPSTVPMKSGHSFRQASESSSAALSSAAMLSRALHIAPPLNDGGEQRQ